jgi:hypothetical protein
LTDTERTERARERLREAEAEGVKRAKANGKADDYAKAASLGLVLWHDIDKASTTDRLVKGVIGEHSLAAIAGPSGSGKSFVAIDLGFHLASGMPWFGRKVRRCGVLYVGAEGQEGLRKRIMAVKANRGLTGADLPFALYPHALDLVADSKGAEAVIERVAFLRQMTGIDAWLVIIDTLARCFGAGDENAAVDMNKFVRTCQRIQSKARSAVLVVHHTGKDEGKGMRGSSAFRGAVDTALIVSGTEGIRTMTLDKQKDGEIGATFAFKLLPVALGSDDDGEPVTSCVIEPTTAAPSRAKKKPLPPEALKCADYLKDKLADHGAFVTATGIPHGTRAVKLDLWRDYLKQRGLYTGDAAGRKLFERMKNRLIAENLIAMDGEYVWIVSRH